MARVAGKRVVLFSFVDDHNHVVVVADDLCECTKLGQGLLFALRPIARVPLGPPHVIEVDSDLAVLDDAQLARLGVERIVAAASFIHAAPPDLAGKSRASVASKRAAIHTGRRVGASDAELAHALSIPRRSLRRLAASAVDPFALRALRARLSLETTALGASELAA